jgi:hypothetical protein
VVIRRGPTRIVGTFGWDLKTDVFKPGQWLKGRIYERRCDLSPDGTLMIYFAMNGHWNAEAKGSWTAISKAPDLKALTLYAKGDCWNGGGLFINSGSYLLNERYRDHDLLRDTLNLACLRGVPPDVPYGNNECLGPYDARLLRDGWTLDPARSSASRQVFDKRLGGGLVLRKFCHIGRGDKARGIYHDSHVIALGEDILLDGANWEWAEIVGRRLAWAEAGKLLCVDLSKRQDPARFSEQANLLKDFSTETFERRQALYGA